MCQHARMPELQFPKFGQSADEWTASQPPARALGPVRLRVFCWHSATSSAPVAEVRGDTIIVGERRYTLNESQPIHGRCQSCPEGRQRFELNAARIIEYLGQPGPPVAKVQVEDVGRRV